MVVGVGGGSVESEGRTALLGDSGVVCMVTGCCACRERWWQWRRRIRKTNGRRSSWLPRFRFRTHNLRRDRRASKFPRAKRVIVGVIFRFRGSCRSVGRRSGGYRRRGGRRVRGVGDVGLVGALNFAPSHGLLVIVGVVGDE